MAAGLKYGMSALLLAGLGNFGMAHAEVRTLSGQFMDVTYDTGWLPSALTDAQLIETPFQWDCSGANCVVTGSPTASIVFHSAAGEVETIADSGVIELVFQTHIKTSVNVVDPLGKAWGIAAADNGKWRFGVSIAGQDRPADAQFATAYGQLRTYVERAAPGKHILPTWTDGSMTPGPYPKGGRPGYTGQTIIGLDQIGLVTWGPGATGQSLLDPDGTNHTSPAINSNWKILSEVFSAYYALPSTTDPRCTSLVCMGFAAGTLDINGLVFSMPITATAAASSVPEADTGAMTLLGLGTLGWCMRRRASAQRA